MGTPMRTLPMLLVVVGLAASCRDEQAGPPQRIGKGAPAATAPLGARALEAPPADLTFRSGASWAGGAVRYLGSRVDPQSPKPGQAVRLSHYFTALQGPPQGFGFFAHLVDAASGQMVANLDHEIQDGAAPLGSWPLGKVIEDQHSITLPSQPGKLRVLLGFWRGDSRLAVDDPSAHDGQNRMLGPTLGGDEEKLPEYRTVRVSQPPAIDGALDDAAWRDAPAVELVGSFDSRRPQLRTTARIVWDDQNLYVAFDCEDPDAWGTLMRKDDPIYNQEVVEVFIDANADGRTYNELQVSPNNVNFDASFVARRSNLEAAMAWESGMKTAVKVRGTVNEPSDRDDGWSAEMQIPFASLTEVPNVPPKPGDRWRFNLYRLEHLNGRRQIEGQAFSPLFVGDFHHLPRFGWLIF